MHLQTFATWIAETPVEDIPDEVMHTAARHIRDCFGVALAASEHPAGKTIRGLVRGVEGAGGQASIWSRDGRRTTPEEAAWANGSLTHMLDFDDTGFSHPSACIVPAVMALGESIGASGRDVVAAVVMGYETFERIARCSREWEATLRRRGFHPTSVWGPPAAAAGCAKLLGLSGEQVARAICIGASSSAGMNDHIGTWTKGLHAGNSARGGLEAARLTEAGYLGSTTTIDGPRGLLNAMSVDGPVDTTSISRELGEVWAIINPGLRIKFYPVCGYSLRAVEGAIELREELGLTPQNIQSVTIEAHPTALDTLRHDQPQNEFEARFSLPYSVAAPLLDGELTLESFEAPRFNSSAVKDMLARISVRQADEWGPEKTMHTPITVTTTDGATHTKDVRFAVGSPENPATEAHLSGKFATCARRVADDATATRLSEALGALQHQGAVRDVVAILHG